MGKDKALIEINGQSFLSLVVNICSNVCKTILISSNNPNHQIKNFRIIQDEVEDCGPMAGIYSCLKQSETDWNIILSIDSVFVKPGFIKFLISKTGNFDVVVPVHNHKMEPLIALYHKNSLPKMNQMLNNGNYKMHNLLKKIQVNYVESAQWIENYPSIFVNINLLNDL